MELKRFHLYEWNHSSDPTLMYVGTENGWHQFTKSQDGRLGNVWCEITDKELDMIKAIPMTYRHVMLQDDGIMKRGNKVMIINTNVSSNRWEVMTADGLISRVSTDEVASIADIEEKVEEAEQIIKKYKDLI